MSRKPISETADRLKPGKPHDSGQATSSSAHVRSSVSFLNPDIVPGSTHLERAPSLNRLHAQSSTETSGLGETVTSGFSSQESVLSYLGDERDRSGGSSFVDRSRRRTGGSPGSGRVVIEHDIHTKEVSPSIPYGLSFQQTSKQQRQQDQYLTIPQPVQRVDRQDIQTRHEDVQRSKHDPHLVDNQQASGRRQKSTRDTGGRSLTPQEAKEEYEQRQRRVKQPQRKRESENVKISIPEESKRAGTVLSSSEKQRSSSGHRRKETDHIDPANVKEHPLGPSTAEARRRTNSSSSNRDFGDPVSKTEEFRQSSRGDKLDGANTAAVKSRQRSKENPTNRPAPRSNAKSSSRDSLELSSTSIPTSAGSVRSDVTARNRDKSVTDLNSSDHERRSSSKSRDEIKTHSSSSSKSFDSQISVIKPYNSKINPLGDSSVANPKSQEIDKSVLPDSSQPNSEKRRHYPSTSDLARSLPKFPDAQIGASGKVSHRSLDEGKDHRGPHRNVHGPNRGNRTGSQLEGKESYSRQRSEPVETGNLTKEHRDYERSRSWDNQRVDEDAAISGGKGIRYQRPEDERYRGGQTDSALGVTNGKKYAIISARDTAGKVKVSDVQDIDIGPVLIRRTDHNPRDSRVGASGVGERSGEGSRPKHSRERKVDPSDAVERPREKASSRSSHTRQALPDRYEVGQGEHMQGRRSLHRVSNDDRSREEENTRNDLVDDDRTMSYERLFHQARGGMNGTGGGGSRTYPAALDGGYSTPPTRPGGTLFGQSYSNISKSGQIQRPSDVPSSGVVGGVANPHGQAVPVQPHTRASYTKFQVHQPQTGQAVTVKLTSPSDSELKLENVEKGLERRDSRSSNKSYTSKSSGLFLGTNSGSAWAKWSRERRASYRKRIEKMEQADPKASTETAKVSTPIKKARQEGLKFIHPDLEATYLSEEDLNELRRHKQQQVQAMRVIEKSRRHKFRTKNEVKMTPEEWHVLQDFWSQILWDICELRCVYLYDHQHYQPLVAETQ